jgi:hypothetical protein
MVDVAGGSHTHLTMRVPNLEGQEPRPFSGALVRVAAVYERRFPPNESE